MTDMSRASGSPYLTRRSVLTGVAAGSALAISGLALEKAEAAGPVRRERREESFDDGWLFFRGAADGAQDRSFDDISWRRLDLPHDYSIEDVPGGSDDGGATAEPSNAVNIFAVDQVTSPPPPKIGPFDIENTPGGPAGPGGGRLVGYTTNGEAWYRKHFTVAGLDETGRVELRFDGAYCYLDVWLNGNHLGFVPNGYIPFHFDLTPHLLLSGENVLAVRMRNTGQTARWYSGSGIYRHTRLVVTTAVRIPRWGVAVTTPDVASTQARVRTKVRVENTRGSYVTAVLRNTLFAPDGRQVAKTTSGTVPIEAGATEVVTFSQIVKNPDLWSPDSPALYTARSEVLIDGRVVDEVTETFGIRSIVMNNKGFFLNGKPITMRGGNIHHDHGPLGSVAPYRAEERRIQLLKGAGFNAIRSSHNCPNPLLLDACDRLGMLVYDEFTDVWEEPKGDINGYHQYFPTHWPEDIQRWVSNGMNHPSVVIRSTGNEIGLVPGGQLPEQRYARSKQLADTVRRLDPTRPVTQGGASNIGTSGELNFTDHLDIGDVHYLHDYSDLHARYPDKPFLQSESYCAALYDDWKLVIDNDFAIGDFVWTAWDYIGEAGVGAAIALPLDAEQLPADPFLTVLGTVPYPWYTAGCGDLDLIGQRRGQNLYRNVVWGLSDLELAVERPTPGLQTQAYGWSWYDELESWTWDVLPGQSMRVRAYSRGDKVELFLNGISVASKTLADADKHIATFDVPYTPGTLVAIASRAGEEIARKTLRTVGAPAALRLRPDRQRITTSRDDLAYIVIEVVDAQGNLVPDAVVKAEFDVTGGTLVGMANGNAHNVDSFTRPRRWTYHGMALAVVQPPGKAGMIAVNAFAADLRADAITIDVVDQPYPSI